MPRLSSSGGRAAIGDGAPSKFTCPRVWYWVSFGKKSRSDKGLFPSAPLSARNRQQSQWRPSKPRSHAFAVLIAARFLVLKIHSELDNAGVEILDRLSISGKRNSACAEKRIDCGSTRMVKEIKELFD